MEQGRFREALRVYDDLTSISAVPMPAEVEYAVAVASARLGLLSRAATRAASAWSRFHTEGDQHGTMRVANLLGGVAFQQGRVNAAAALFEETIERAHTLGRADLAARAANNLASLKHLQGEDLFAQNLYRSALVVHERHSDRRGMAQTIHNLALVQSAQGRSDEAAETHARAVALAEGQEDVGLLGLTLVGRAESALQLNNETAAAADLLRARGLFEQAGDEVGVGDVERLEGWLEFRGSRYQCALGHARRGWSIGAKVENPQLMGECASLSALAYRALKRQDEAQTSRASAIASFESLGAVSLLHRFERDWAA